MRYTHLEQTAQTTVSSSLALNVASVHALGLRRNGPAEPPLRPCGNSAGAVAGPSYWRGKALSGTAFAFSPLIGDAVCRHSGCYRKKQLLVTEQRQHQPELLRRQRR